MNIRRFLLSSAAFLAIAGGEAAQAQTLPQSAATLDGNATASPSTLAPPAPEMGSSVLGTRTLPNAPGWSGPDFQWNARALFQESYTTNATGTPGGSQSDYLSSPGFVSDLHEHSPRIVLDANYNLIADFYAGGTLPTQVSNSLQTLGSVDVIPEYLNLDLRAFAQPVVTSGFGAISADGREIPGAFRNSYGYFGTPVLTFNLGDFASLKTMPSYGQVFFTIPPGTSAANSIPGLGGPENTTVRTATEEIQSGTDFDRLNWKLVGLLSETDRQQSLLSEKSGIADGRYAINYEWSLLATGGYDAISNSVALAHNVSGPVALAGVGLTLGQDFSFRAEAGERYNSLSYNGNLLYDLTPTSMLTAAANDYVQTPEGQLLNNLTNLTALSNGTLTSMNDVLGNGTASSLNAFNVQSPDTPALDQIISRYQTAFVSFIEDFERTRASISLFRTHRTLLTAGITGPGTADSWGAQIQASHNITPLLTATLGGGYSNSQEFGGQASSINAQGQLAFSLSQATQIYLRASYIDRLSSTSLLALSPLSGNGSDFRATLGITHTLW